ncbi:hypothetical protein [Paenibacillus jamilae]|nr:hypothetical protein [Paenibacillus jamilae]
MAFIQRYATNQTGAITFIGNTLGLARSASAGVYQHQSRWMDAGSSAQ